MNTIWFYGGTLFNKVDIEQDIFILYIMSRKFDVIYITVDIAFSDDINNRLNILMERGHNIVDFKTEVLKDRMKSLETSGS